LKGLQKSDYKDSPFHSFPFFDPSCSNVMDTVKSTSKEDTVQHLNSEIFKMIGDLGNISESHQIAKMRHHFNKLEKIAVKSMNLKNLLYVLS
jgi:hypothetical protein